MGTVWKLMNMKLKAGATTLTTIKKNGLKTKIEFNKKTKDVLIEFVKDNR